MPFLLIPTASIAVGHEPTPQFDASAVIRPNAGFRLNLSVAMIYRCLYAPFVNAPGNFSVFRQLADEVVHGAEDFSFVGTEDVVIGVGQADYCSRGNTCCESIGHVGASCEFECYPCGVMGGIRGKGPSCGTAKMARQEAIILVVERKRAAILGRFATYPPLTSDRRIVHTLVDYRGKNADVN